MKHKGKFLILILAVICLRAGAQQNSTAYFMNYLPQSSFINPSVIPVCNFYISLPGVSMEIKNNAFAISDFIYYHTEPSKKYITPFNENATATERNNFLSTLKSLNTVGLDYNFNIFGLGFRANKSFFTFQITQRFETSFSYSPDFINFIFDARDNNLGNQFNLSDIGYQNSMFQEISLGIAKKIDNSLSFGIRGKLLLGTVNMEISNPEILVDFEIDSVVHTAFELKGSAPSWFYQIYETNGVYDSSKFLNFDDMNISNMLHPEINPGFGVDFGVNYNSGNKLNLSFSVLDLGFIRWRNNTFSVSQDINFNFKDYIESADENPLDMVIDSVINSFVIGTDAPYTTLLSSKIIVGASYDLTRRLGFGILSYNQLYKSKIFPRLTLSANLKPFRWLSTSFSYSLLNKEYYNFGLGLSYKPGPLNFYIIGDTYPFKFSREGDIPIPTSLKGFRMQFGVNLIFGTGKILKAEKDTPLLVE